MKEDESIKKISKSFFRLLISDPFSMVLKL